MGEVLQLSELRTDGGTQSRARLDSKVVEEYAEAMKAGTQFPAIVVFFDGESHWVADGFHRVAAARLAGRGEIRCDVRQGTVRAAMLHSVGANAAHGLKRTNADKRRAVEMLLADEEWRAKSDRWIAEQCGVHWTFVGDMRKKLNWCPTPVDGASSKNETLDAKISTEAGASVVPRTGRDWKERRMPSRTEEPNVDQRHAAAPAPTPYVSKKKNVREFDEQVRALHADGLPPSEIAKQLGRSVDRVNNAKRRQQLVARPSPIAGLMQTAETGSDFWRTAAENFRPHWSESSEQEQQKLIRELEGQVRAIQQFVQRLKKEARRSIAS